MTTEDRDDTAETLTVELWRGHAGEGRFEVYQVPRRASQTVLDVVTWVQRHRAPDLAYRFACRVGMCGSCAMTVNGRPRWTCRTHVARVAGRGALRIGPLRNAPVIRDLVTDMAGFFDKWRDCARPARVSEQIAPAIRLRASTPAKNIVRRPARPSNVSAVVSVTPPATWSPGDPSTSGRRH